MANYNLTPNMNLPNPVPGVDPGPDYANNLQSSLNILDQHNHSSGSGVPITPSGLNISADLPFNSNNATLLRSTRFAKQSAVSGASDLNCLYVLNDGNLYFNDGAGDPAIQMTLGGAVNATSSGIASGTNSAAFVSSTLVVLSASTTPANIKGASLLLGNNSAGTHYLTLSPPNSMGADYSLTLPSIPASQSFLTVDTSGNIAAYAPINQGITRTNLAAVGQVVSPSSGLFSTASGSPVAVTNLSLTITTTGRPIMLFLQPDGTGVSSGIGVSGIGPASIVGSIYFYRGSTLIAAQNVSLNSNASGSMSVASPGGSCQFLDTPSAGTQTYIVKASLSTGSLIFVSDCVLVAYEL